MLGRVAAAGSLGLLLAAVGFAEDDFDPATYPGLRGSALYPPPGLVKEKSEGGVTDAEPKWKDLDDWGPLGPKANRIPHDACDLCFTLEDNTGMDEYQIWEYLETDGPKGAIFLPRDIPNPVGGYVNTVDPETGEKIWYIGEEEYRGLTDEDYLTDTAARSIIEMKRIHLRNQSLLGNIPGLVSDGPNFDHSGFTVAIDEEHFEESRSLVPEFLEGVPVTVEKGTPIEALNLSSYKYRPIPSGDAVGVEFGYLDGEPQYSIGTLGPHIVVKPPQVSQCCKILLLTNAHIVKRYLDRSSVLGPVRQPPEDGDTTIGSVWHAFTLLYWGSPDVINYTWQRPDIAAIDTTDELQLVPFNYPEGTEPVRHLQYSKSKYVDGPSGKIEKNKYLKYNTKLKIWGTHTNGKVARFLESDICLTYQRQRNFIGSYNYYRVCGASRIKSEDAQSGDSGALVTQKGTGNRDVVGMIFAKDTGSTDTYIIPGEDIKSAFSSAGKPFSHYWGTMQAYDEPATTPK